MERHPAETMIQLAYGYRISRCLHAAVELGVPDAIGEEPVALEPLAEATGADPETLFRLMMTLVARGVFAREDGQFAHTAGSRLLRSDAPRSLSGFVRFAGADYQWASWGALPEAVRTGEAAFDSLYGRNSFEYYADHPEDERVFDQAMSGIATANIAAVTRTYDFGQFSTVADIGGGRGHLLRGVLKAAPNARGVLFDRPSVAEHARSLGGERMDFVGGDFFIGDLPAADAYLFMMILHDWSDADCVRILKNLRRTAPPHAKVLVIETVLPEDDGGLLGRLVDMTMLVLTGGRERTHAQYAALLAEAGWRVVGPAIATPSHMSIVEAVLA